MLELLTLFMILVVSVYVTMPLWRSSSTRLIMENAKELKIKELAFQKRLLRETIRDLEFDHQTGKLSLEDFQVILQEKTKSLSDIESSILQSLGTEAEEIDSRLEREIAQSKHILSQ